MFDSKQSIFAIALATLCAAPAIAATFNETITFDATLTSGTLECGASYIDTRNCEDRFGAVSGSSANDLMFGKTLNGVYSGEISLSVEDDRVVAATCEIGGANCMFDRLFLRGPFGPSARLNFSESYAVLSTFSLEDDTGSYLFGTDVEDSDDGGVQFYSRVRFDLENVEREIAVVPLMGSAGFLFAALGGFWGVSRRKRA